MKNNENNLVISLGRIATEGYYDYQEIRKAQYNRIRDIVRRKIENIPMKTPEEKKEQKEYLKKFKDNEILEYLKKLEKQNKIQKHEHKYLSKLLEIAKDTKNTEKNYKKLMDQYLQKEKIWYLWLEKIRGISSVLGSNLIKNFGYCETYDYVSSLWRHTGYDPEGAKGLRRGEEIHYSPKLKTFIWKIGDSFIKQRTPVYRGIYDNEKQRQLSLMKNEASNAPKSRLHADLRARRKMVKIFMQHYWLICRKIKKLHVNKPYPIDKLGHKHFIEPPHNPFVDKTNNKFVNHKKNENHAKIVNHSKYENQ